MIKKDLNLDLQHKGVEPAFYFFVQLWHELLDHRTLDIYQYTLLDSYSVLKELVSVIDNTRNGLFTSNHNVDACKEECAKIVADDLILQKRHRPLWNTLSRHLHSKCSNNNELLSLQFQIKYALNQLTDHYIEWIFEETYFAIIHKQYDAVIHHTKALISQCMSKGWSAKGLYQCDRLFNSGEEHVQLEEQWRKFKNHLLQHEHEFYVYINIKTQDISSFTEASQTDSPLTFSVETGAEIVQNCPNYLDKAKNKFDRQKRYIKFKIQSQDVYSASYKAVSKLSDKINVLSFFNMIKVWDMKDIYIIAVDFNSHYCKGFNCEDLFKTYDYLDAASNIFVSTSKIMSELPSIGISEKLLGAFRYTNISRASFFHEEKYMTLWIALESLSRTNMNGDIISCVKATLPAALSTRYLFRIMRNFAEDLIRCNVNLTFSSCEYDIDNSSKTQLVKDLLVVFKDESLSRELIDKCNCSELLYHRVNKIHDIVGNLESAVKCYTEYYEKINWQIQRLYRLRNQIAHSATTEILSLTIYAEYLYDYLSILVSEIVFCAENNNLKTIDEVFCKIRDNYTVLYEILKQKTQQISLEDKELLDKTIFTTGIIQFI